MPEYQSEIVLGTKYRDTQTGLEGHAVVISFHQHACERVVLEYAEANDLKLVEFDAVRLVSLEPKKTKPEPVPTGAVQGTIQRSGRRKK